jgi:hypothetical protein
MRRIAAGRAGAEGQRIIHAVDRVHRHAIPFPGRPADQNAAILRCLADIKI